MKIVYKLLEVSSFWPAVEVVRRIRLHRSCRFFRIGVLVGSDQVRFTGKLLAAET